MRSLCQKNGTAQSLFNRCSSVSGTGMAETTDSEADIRTDSERGWY